MGPTALLPLRRMSCCVSLSPVGINNHPRPSLNPRILYLSQHATTRPPRAIKIIWIIKYIPIYRPKLIFHNFHLVTTRIYKTRKKVKRSCLSWSEFFACLGAVVWKFSANNLYLYSDWWWTKSNRTVISCFFTTSFPLRSYAESYY
jgi:hypothetical protein